jgi:hypothetical protein
MPLMHPGMLAVCANKRYAAEWPPSVSAEGVHGCGYVSVCGVNLLVVLVLCVLEGYCALDRPSFGCLKDGVAC